MATFSIVAPLTALPRHPPIIASTAGERLQQSSDAHAVPVRPHLAAAAAFSAGALACATKSTKRQRQHRKRARLYGSGTKTSANDNEALLAKLQGHWCDDMGNVIIISGELARFSDGSGAWRIETSEEDGLLWMRGARFVGTPERPIWRFENGMERHLVKSENVTASERAWAETFHQFKDAQTQIRQRIWANIVAGDIDEAVSLQATWMKSVSFPSGCSLEQQMLLAVGRWHLPGVCFRHKRYGYRGMIIACEPWCTAPATWRSKLKVSTTPRGAFYHCLVDERDRPGGQSTFVPEEDIEICHDATVEHFLVRLLFVHCDEIRGYLPIPKLSDVLWKHWATCCPIWEASEPQPPATAQQLN